MDAGKLIQDFNQQAIKDPLSLPVLMFIYWYYLPYMIAGSNEVDKWTTQVSLNGARWKRWTDPKTYSICKV